MEPKPAPPEEPDFDASGTEVPVTVNPSPVSAPVENTIDNVIEKPADPNTPVATEPEPEPEPESTPSADLPEVPQVATEQPAPTDSEQPAQPETQSAEAKPEHAPLPELHDKPPVPKPAGSGMAMTVAGTLLVVVALSGLAVFAYLQSK